MNFGKSHGKGRGLCLLVVSVSDLRRWQRPCGGALGTQAVGSALREAEEARMEQVTACLTFGGLTDASCTKATDLTLQEEIAASMSALRELLVDAAPSNCRMRISCSTALGGLAAAIGRTHSPHQDEPLPLLVPREMADGPSLASLQRISRTDGATLISVGRPQHASGRVEWLVRRAGKLIVRRILPPGCPGMNSQDAPGLSGRYLLAPSLVARCAGRHPQAITEEALPALLNAAIASGERLVARQQVAVPCPAERVRPLEPAMSRLHEIQEL